MGEGGHRGDASRAQRSGGGALARCHTDAIGRAAEQPHPAGQRGAREPLERAVGLGGGGPRGVRQLQTPAEQRERVFARKGDDRLDSGERRQTGIAAGEDVDAGELAQILDQSSEHEVPFVGDAWRQGPPGQPSAAEELEGEDPHGTMALSPAIRRERKSSATRSARSIGVTPCKPLQPGMPLTSSTSHLPSRSRTRSTPA